MMQFSFDEAQNLFQDSLRKALDRLPCVNDRAQYLSADAEQRQAIWDALTKTGLISLPFDSPLANTSVDATIKNASITTDSQALRERFIGTMQLHYAAAAMMVVGERLVLEPVLNSVFQANLILCLCQPFQQSDTGEQWQKLVTDICDSKTSLSYIDGSTVNGSTINDSTVDESANHHTKEIVTPANLNCHWHIENQNNTQYFILNGQIKHCIDVGENNGLIICLNKRDATMADSDATAIFYLPINHHSIQFEQYRYYDGHRGLNLQLDQLRLNQSQCLMQGNEANIINTLIKDYSSILLCAEAFGIVCVVLQQTIDYAKTRQQFGQPISGFQVIRHRLADMYIAVENFRSILFATLDHAQSGPIKSVDLNVLIYQTIQAARLIGQQSVQIHGGMGMIDELMIGHYFKRLTCISVQLGQADQIARNLGKTLLTAAGTLV